MPDLQNNRPAARKFPAQIIHETLALKARLSTLTESTERFYGELTRKLVALAAAFDNNCGYPTFLHPLAMEFVALNQRLQMLSDITDEKMQLLQDTRSRRTFIRTGHMKRWIESEVPEHAIQMLLRQLGLQFKIMSNTLQNVLDNLRYSSGHDGIGGTYQAFTLTRPIALPLLTPLIDAQAVTESVPDMATSDLPESIKRHQARFLENFSFFKREAESLAAVDKDLSRKLLADIRRERAEP